MLCAQMPFCLFWIFCLLDISVVLLTDLFVPVLYEIETGERAFLNFILTYMFTMVTLQIYLWACLSNLF